jgi:catechol 2,3-dioxygenase-like lactoylglutathione lyase family enzyme
MDWKIELIFVPVSDVDRARDFYASLGFSIDYDVVVNDDLRFVQATPPGSACSIAFGVGIGVGRQPVAPGSLHAIQVVVPSAEEVLAQLHGLGIEAEGVRDLDWGRFVDFADPDGNTWTLQELPPREPVTS